MKYIPICAIDFDETTGIVASSNNESAVYNLDDFSVDVFFDVDLKTVCSFRGYIGQ